EEVTRCGLPVRVRGLPGGEQESLHLAGEQRGGGLRLAVLALLTALGRWGLLAGQGRVLLGGEGLQQRRRHHGRLGEGVEQRLGVLHGGREVAGSDLVDHLDHAELQGRGGAGRRRGCTGLVGHLRRTVAIGRRRLRAAGGQQPAAGQQQGRSGQQHTAAGEGGSGR